MERICFSNHNFLLLIVDPIEKREKNAKVNMPKYRVATYHPL